MPARTREAAWRRAVGGPRRRWRRCCCGAPARCGQHGAAQLAAPAVEAAPEVRGRAEVIDGDTLAIGATRVRLFGIDAPEAGQRCGGAGAPGPAARSRRRGWRALAGAR